MTFRERVEESPVGWLVGVGAACFAAGMFVTLGFVQIMVSDRGPRQAQAPKNTAGPSPTPIFHIPVAPTAANNLSLGSSPSPTPTESGNMEMTVQEFTRRYLELDGRFAEQEAFVERANRKRVRWKVLFLYPNSTFEGMTASFDVPSESPGERPLIGSPVRWAHFHSNFRDRLYSLRRGDLIEITGVLNVSDRNTVILEADDFDIIATSSPTPRIKKSR